jgi:hypothetical protein
MPAIGKYIGDSLASLVTEASYAATDRAQRSIARDVQDVMFATAVAATPVKTGALRESWLKPMVERYASRTEAKIVNTHWSAQLLEHGAQAHDETPRDKRSITTPFGERASARNPGFRGYHMASKAAQVAETILPMTAEKPLRAYVSELESAIEASKRR